MKISAPFDPKSHAQPQRSDNLTPQPNQPEQLAPTRETQDIRQTNSYTSRASSALNQANWLEQSDSSDSDILHHEHHGLSLSAPASLVHLGDTTLNTVPFQSKTLNKRQASPQCFETHHRAEQHPTSEHQAAAQVPLTTSLPNLGRFKNRGILKHTQQKAQQNLEKKLCDTLCTLASENSRPLKKPLYQQAHKIKKFYPEAGSQLGIFTQLLLGKTPQFVKQPNRDHINLNLLHIELRTLLQPNVDILADFFQNPQWTDLAIAAIDHYVLELGGADDSELISLLALHKQVAHHLQKTEQGRNILAKADIKNNPVISTPSTPEQIRTYHKQWRPVMPSHLKLLREHTLETAVKPKQANKRMSQQEIDSWRLKMIEDVSQKTGQNFEDTSTTSHTSAGIKKNVSIVSVADKSVNLSEQPDIKHQLKVDMHTILQQLYRPVEHKSTRLDVLKKYYNAADALFSAVHHALDPEDNHIYSKDYRARMTSDLSLGIKHLYREVQSGRLSVDSFLSNVYQRVLINMLNVKTPNPQDHIKYPATGLYSSRNQSQLYKSRPDLLLINPSSAQVSGQHPRPVNRASFDILDEFKNQDIQFLKVSLAHYFKSSPLTKNLLTIIQSKGSDSLFKLSHHDYSVLQALVDSALLNSLMDLAGFAKRKFDPQLYAAAITSPSLKSFKPNDSSATSASTSTLNAKAEIVSKALVDLCKQHPIVRQLYETTMKPTPKNILHYNQSKTLTRATGNDTAEPTLTF